MKPADLALFRMAGEPTLSPDGRVAVVPVTRMDLDEDEYRTQLWLAPTDGGSPPRRLTHGHSDNSPRFSPDGRWLAFLRAEKEGKPQLHVLPMEGGDARPVTTKDHHPIGAGAPVWSPDSTRIAYVARVPEDGRYGTKEKVTPDKEPPRRITTFLYRLDNVGFILDRRPHVFVVDPFADEPAPVRITEGDFDHEAVSWSPDGSLLAFSSPREQNVDDTPLRADVFVCAPDGSGLRKVTDGRLGAWEPVFSADASTLYFVGMNMGESGHDWVSQTPGLFSVPVDGSAVPTRLTDEESVELAGRPIVVEDGVLVNRENRGALDLIVVPFGGGPVRSALSGSRQAKAYDAAAGVVVATVADGSTVGELVALRDGAERTLTSFGAELTETGRLHDMQEITATAPDGYPVHGWVVRPEGSGPHPVLLMIHGGPQAQYGWTLFDEAQVYAGAGYAVVMGNPRGSSGYGKAHRLWIKGDVGERSATDLFALLDHALQAPDLDGQRLGVLGGSHGGFMTSWLVGHSDRFKAAISERAVNAVDSFTGSSDIGWEFSRELYGDPEAQARQSPLTYVDQINTPVLIIHSEHDWRCPVEQAQRLFVALKMRGVPTELLLFPAEGHELSRSGLPSHRVARFEAVLDWWSRYL